MRESILMNGFVFSMRHWKYN